MNVAMSRECNALAGLWPEAARRDAYGAPMIGSEPGFSTVPRAGARSRARAAAGARRGRSERLLAPVARRPQPRARADRRPGLVRVAGVLDRGRRRLRRAPRRRPDVRRPVWPAARSRRAARARRLARRGRRDRAVPARSRCLRRRTGEPAEAGGVVAGLLVAPAAEAPLERVERRRGGRGPRARGRPLLRAVAARSRAAAAATS